VFVIFVKINKEYFRFVYFWKKSFFFCLFTPQLTNWSEFHDQVWLVAQTLQPLTSRLSGTRVHIHTHMIYDWRIRSVFDISRVEWKVSNILATRLWPSPPRSCIYFASDTRLFWHLIFVSSEPTSANWLTKYWQFVKLC